jgi:hypothetical protein
MFPDFYGYHYCIILLFFVYDEALMSYESNEASSLATRVILVALLTAFFAQVACKTSVGFLWIPPLVTTLMILPYVSGREMPSRIGGLKAYWMMRTESCLT